MATRPRRGSATSRPVASSLPGSGWRLRYLRAVKATDGPDAEPAADTPPHKVHDASATIQVQRTPAGNTGARAAVTTGSSAAVGSLPQRPAPLALRRMASQRRLLGLPELQQTPASPKPRRQSEQGVLSKAQRDALFQEDEYDDDDDEDEEGMIETTTTAAAAGNPRVPPALGGLGGLLHGPRSSSLGDVLSPRSPATSDSAPLTGAAPRASASHSNVLASPPNAGTANNLPSPSLALSPRPTSPSVTSSSSSSSAAASGLSAIFGRSTRPPSAVDSGELKQDRVHAGHSRATTTTTVAAVMTDTTDVTQHRRPSPSPSAAVSDTEQASLAPSASSSPPSSSSVTPGAISTARGSAASPRESRDADEPGNQPLLPARGASGVRGALRPSPLASSTVYAATASVTVERRRRSAGAAATTAITEAAVSVLSIANRNTTTTSSSSASSSSSSTADASAPTTSPLRSRKQLSSSLPVDDSHGLHPSAATIGTSDATAVPPHALAAGTTGVRQHDSRASPAAPSAPLAYAAFASPRLSRCSDDMAAGEEDERPGLLVGGSPSFSHLHRGLAREDRESDGGVSEGEAADDDYDNDDDEEDEEEQEDRLVFQEEFEEDEAGDDGQQQHHHESENHATAAVAASASATRNESTAVFVPPHVLAQHNSGELVPGRPPR